jgi:hypothetical protein
LLTRREGVELVLEEVGVLGVEVTAVDNNIISHLISDLCSSPPKIKQPAVVWKKGKKADSRPDQLATVSSDPSPLSDDLGRVYEVLEDLLVNDGESAGTRTLLTDLGVTGWFAEHSTLSEEDDVTVRELFLELTGEPGHYERLQGKGQRTRVLG